MADGSFSCFLHLPSTPQGSVIITVVTMDMFYYTFVRYPACSFLSHCSIRLAFNVAHDIKVQTRLG